MATLLELSKKLESLPAVSPAVLQLIKIIDDFKTTRDDILKLVTLDQVLFANAFKYANSAAIASVRRLTSLTEIIDILGFGIIKNIAVLTALKKSVTDHEQWFSSIFLGVAAKNIAKKLRKDYRQCEDIYLAALLASYGNFALKYFYPEEHKIINSISDFKSKLKKEKELFGLNHLELSAEILSKWGIPVAVIKIIKNHADATETEFSDNDSILELARFFLTHKDSTNEELEFALKEEHNFKTLNLDINKFWIDEIKLETENFVSF